MVHQVSKCTSAALFRKVDQIQSVDFHPTKPFIFLATRTHVRVYSLSLYFSKQERGSCVVAGMGEGKEAVVGKPETAEVA